MESAYLNDNLFKKLSDKESPYWQYFDCKGDIQLGWWYHQAIYPKDVIMKAEKYHRRGICGKPIRSLEL